MLPSLSSLVLNELLFNVFLLFVTDEEESKLHLLQVLDGLFEIVRDDGRSDVQPTELLDHRHVQVQGVILHLLLGCLVLLNGEQLSRLLLLFLRDLRLDLEDALLLGVGPHDLALLDLLLDLLPDALLPLASLLLQCRLLSSHAALRLAQGTVLDQSAIQQMVLLLAVLQEEVAHIDLVKIRVHIQALKLCFFPLALLLIFFLPALIFSLLPLLLSLLHLFDLLLALILSLFLLFLPLALLLFALNHALLDALHPFDLMDLDELFLIRK